MGFNLMVIVPRDLPSRAVTLNAALAGTAIGVVVDRRQGERRCAHQAAGGERRHGDRRGARRVLAYVYACPVVALEAPPSAGRPLDDPAGGPSSSTGPGGTGFTEPALTAGWTAEMPREARG